MSKPASTTSVGSCCKGWTELSSERRRTRAWQYLHELAHSRVPFSVSFYAERAELSIFDADANVQVALQRRWLRHSVNEYAHRGAPALYQGQLPKRGR